MNRIINRIELPRALKGDEPSGLVKDLESIVTMYRNSPGELDIRPEDDLFDNDLSCMVSYSKRGNERTLEGFAQYRIDSDIKSSSIENLYVDPRTRRKGVGEAIVGAVMSEARRAGVPTLSVFSTTEAIEFYSKIGFRTDNKSTLQDHSPWMVIDTDQKLK